MFRVYRAWMMVLVCISVMLAACGGNSPTIAPTDNPASPIGGNLDAVLQVLNSSGLTVVNAGQAAGPNHFDLTPTLLTVNGETVEVYVFADEASAVSAATSVSDMLTRTRWAAPPHFFQKGGTIAFYLGTTQEIVSALTAYYGPEIVAQVAEPMGEGDGAAESVDQVNIYFVALEDNGAIGDKIGCNDSIVEVLRDITPTASPIEAALTEMFAQKDQYYGESGFYNALYQSNLAVESATVSEGLATVYLTGEFVLGGECDNPRFKAQIEYTVLQFPGVEAVAIFINGSPIDDLLSGQG